MEASLSKGLISHSARSICLYFLSPHAWISEVQFQLRCASTECDGELKIKMLYNFLTRNLRCASANFEFRFTLGSSGHPKAFVLVASLSESVVTMNWACNLMITISLRKKKVTALLFQSTVTSCHGISSSSDLNQNLKVQRCTKNKNKHFIGLFWTLKKKKKVLGQGKLEGWVIALRGSYFLMQVVPSKFYDGESCLIKVPGFLFALW